MKQYLIIEADTDDGDYITEKTEITNEQLSKLKEILAKVERQKGPGKLVYPKINWRTNEQADGELWEQHPELSDEECNFLNDFCPSGEYGIHTIESIDLLLVSKEENLL